MTSWHQLTCGLLTAGPSFSGWLAGWLASIAQPNGHRLEFGPIGPFFLWHGPSLEMVFSSFWAIKEPIAL